MIFKFIPVIPGITYKQIKLAFESRWWTFWEYHKDDFAILGGMDWVPYINDCMAEIIPFDEREEEIILQNIQKDRRFRNVLKCPISTLQNIYKSENGIR